jgi:hypothetical protein
VRAITRNYRRWLGRALLVAVLALVALKPDETRFYRWNPAGPRDPLWRRMGFQGEGLRDGRSAPEFGLVQRSLLWKVGLPFWFLAASFALPCAVWLLRRGVRRRLDKSGRCPACGYDLRATPDGCPECGAVHGGGAT